MASLLWSLPTPAAFILALLLFHLLFTVVGLGATLLLIPARLSRYALVFAPPVGLCIVSWLGWHSVWLGFRGTNASAPIIAAIACSLLAASALRKDRAHLADVFNRDVLIAFAVALCGAVALSVPALVEPHLTTVSAGNNDVASYALNERFLMLHSIRDVPGNITEYLGVAGHITSTVFGAFFCSAVAGSLLGLQSYELQNVSINAFALWGGLVLYVLAREVFKYRVPGALILLGGFSFNELIFYVALNGFKAQLAAMALTGCIYCWVIPMLARDSAPTGRELAGATVLTWGLVAAYPHMVPAVFLPLGFLSIAFAIQAKSVRQLRWPALTAAAIFAGAVALSPAKAESTYRYALLMKDVVAGWFMPWISPASFLGLTGKTAFAHLRWPFEAVMGLLAASVIVVGLFRIRSRERDVLLVALAFLTAIGGAYAVLIVTGRTESGFGGYKSFKLLSFFAPVLWCCGLLFLRDMDPRPALRLIQAVVAVALVAGNLIAGGRLTRSVTANHASVSRSVAGLAKLESDPRVTSINIVTPSFWDGMWETTFLFEKILYHKYATYYPAAATLQGEWTLDSGSDRILTVELCHPIQSIRVNEQFVLFAKGVPDLSASWDLGWHGDERTHRWTADRMASIRVRSRSHERVKIALAYTALNITNAVSVALNGERVGGCAGAKPCEILANLNEGDNLLQLVSTLPPERPNSRDPRRLGLAFTTIAIAETGCGISSR